MEWLVGGLSLQEGFGLYFCECPSEGVSALYVECLLEALAREEVPMTPRRLAGRWDAAWSDLVRDVLEPLRHAEGEEPDTLWVVDACGSDRGNEQAWALMFSRFNEVRNAVARALGRPLLILLPPWLMKTLPLDAPDLWSIRRAAERVELGALLKPPTLSPQLYLGLLSASAAQVDGELM